MQGKLVPAAQYLRMSTEQQQYSLLNQAAAIAKYADLRGFAIVKTYEDAARSGLVLRERPGLRELLKDVVASDVPYKAILVYDVSRWGRFQDSDESAAYEFICKSAGVPVHYCAEQFANDCSISSSVMKALKRAMAAEYSRELGVKSYEGQKRLVELGFKMGGSPGYGLRRMLLSPTGERLRVLKPGEYKAVSSDRVILVPGPKCEVSVIRRIFSMALKGMNASAIARELNRLKIKFTDDHPWTPFGISRTLKHRKYVGCSVWGQTSRKLHGANVKVARKDWITKAGSFQPIVSQEIFDRVQRVLRQTTLNRSDTSLLAGLKRLWREKGYLSQIIIDKSRRVPAMNTYYRRFGSLRDIYRLIGYPQWDEYFKRRDRATQTERLHACLVQRIAAMFPDRVSVFHQHAKRRQLLVFDERIVVSVYLCRSIKWPNGRPCWKFDPVRGEKHNITLLCTLNPNNDDVQTFYLFQSLGRTGNYKFGPGNKWVAKAKHLASLSELGGSIVEIDKSSEVDRPREVRLRRKRRG